MIIFGFDLLFANNRERCVFICVGGASKQSFVLFLGRQVGEPFADNLHRVRDALMKFTDHKKANKPRQQK